MAKLPFADAYVHYIDHSHPGLYYTWMQPQAVDKNIGPELERLKVKNWLIDEFLKVTKSSNVIAGVHSEAWAASDMGKDPATETEWLQRESDRVQFPLAAVAFCNLMSPSAEATIERHRKFSILRALRHRSPGDFMADPVFQKGFALVDKYKLSYEFSVRPETMTSGISFAKKFSRTPLAVVHAGFPWDPRSSERVNAWRNGMKALGKFENVSCKISGLVLPDHNWTVESLRPWVLDCINAFGPKRIMFGSHWPVDTLYSSYEKLIDAYREIIKDFSLDEQKDMLARNTLQFYKLKI